MRVLKFGGTSVRDAERIAQVSRIVRNSAAEEAVAVVVSALGGVTDQLVALADQAHHGAQEPALEQVVSDLRQRHLAVARACATDAELPALIELLEDLLAATARQALGASLVGECTPRTRDRILSFGELASTQLVAARLRRDGMEAGACDARNLIVSNSRFGNAQVRPQATALAIRRWFDGLQESASGAAVVQVVTGFLAADERGVTTTLGRGGSDYTAALLGSALDASVVEIWTDVDGVMSADPRRIPSAVSLDQLSFEELMELSHFGAKVIYPPTVQPLRKAGIPLYIRNTLRPEHRGTKVRDGLAGSSTERPLAGVTSTGRVTLFRLEGPGMLGVPGFAGRLFNALASCQISMILITQASSEHSISFATAPGQTEAVCRCVHSEFAAERADGSLYDLLVDEEVCIIAAVGEGMAERTGVAARIFSALSQRCVNVRAIAQGSSERNISTVISARDEDVALRAVHDAFFDSGPAGARSPRHRTPGSGPADPLRLVLAGVGGVGGTLLDILAAHADLDLVAVSSSRRLLADQHGLQPRGAEDLGLALRQGGCAASQERLLEVVERSVALGATAFVDCTASQDIARLHAELLASGCSVVTANKLALAADREFAAPLFDCMTQPYGKTPAYRAEATVGAGLPILGTLMDLVATGDRIDRIEGVFSGTLAFVLAALRSGRSLSDAVRSAHQGGYTEPDPRDDLDGADVARKLLILMRCVRPQVQASDLRVEPLVAAAGGSLEEFWKELASHDEPFAKRRERACASGRELAYLASWERETEVASIGLREVEGDHPAARLSGTDNVFVVHTERSPGGIVIQGPGAGRGVTAAAVLAGVRSLAGRGNGPPGIAAEEAGR